MAQEYDALNVIARLPKDSEIYHLKMKQFMEMSKMRQDVKDKIHQVRMQKVKKEFDMFKINAEGEKSNLQWLDRNRKEKLAQKRQLLEQRNQQELIARQQQQQAPAQQGDPFFPDYAPDEFNPMDNPNIMRKNT